VVEYRKINFKYWQGADKGPANGRAPARSESVNSGRLLVRNFKF